MDEAVISAKELYLNYLNDSTHRFKLFQYLEALSDNDPGFTYNICHNTENKLTGFCWMTSVMRSHFERYHTILFLDVMRRKTNIHLWPYMSIVVVNDLGESQPVIEAVMMSERDESYKFIIESALKMAPNVFPKNVRVVFGDEFFTQDLIQSSGLINAKLFHDHWHLRLNQEKYLDLNCMNRLNIF